MTDDGLSDAEHLAHFGCVGPASDAKYSILGTAVDDDNNFDRAEGSAQERSVKSDSAAQGGPQSGRERSGCKKDASKRTPSRIACKEKHAPVGISSADSSHSAVAGSSLKRTRPMPFLDICSLSPFSVSCSD